MDLRIMRGFMYVGMEKARGGSVTRSWVHNCQPAAKEKKRVHLCGCKLIGYQVI